MRYSGTFKNAYLQLSLHTNSGRIWRLINNFLDFDDNPLSKPKMKITFDLDEDTDGKAGGDDAFFYQNYRDKAANITLSFGGNIANVAIDSKTNVVKGTILVYKESFKERIVDLIFTQPLRLILLRYGFFSLHASAVYRDGDCILINGPAHSGKSAIALSLANSGFNLLTDDICFVKSSGDQAHIFPFSTKMGLNDNLARKYSHFNKHMIKKYRYGGKKRISLKGAMPCPVNELAYKCKILLFPRYRAGENISVKRIESKDALGRLAEGMPIIYPKDALNNMFAVLCDLTNKADSFELQYDESRLDDIPAAVEKIFIRP